MTCNDQRRSQKSATNCSPRACFDREIQRVHPAVSERHAIGLPAQSDFVRQDGSPYPVVDSLITKPRPSSTRTISLLSCRPYPQRAGARIAGPPERHFAALWRVFQPTLRRLGLAQPRFSSAASSCAPQLCPAEPAQSARRTRSWGLRSRLARQPPRSKATPSIARDQFLPKAAAAGVAPIDLGRAPLHEKTRPNAVFATLGSCRADARPLRQRKHAAFETAAPLSAHQPRRDGMDGHAG